ncbi:MULTISPECIES: hypothetical protein [unclassified Rhizobium]|uniref:hypothetical protein n=1 Tax=unclassified Rhizobium TaxID=2613769 RepID=UPI001AE47D4B|nr:MULTISPECIES: hypothetical protein [unclassified Rhizobium]MBP2461177.1 hypothetical protein [Rhizobium sp. PvP014]MBP2528573.1 hypothetical protein [Rhizobium sp. PvP099]
MGDKVVNVWPQDVPTSFWSYHLLRLEQRDLLPLMGVRLEWNFVFAFLFGAALVAVFAWRRFRQPSSQPDEYDYEVVKRLAPTQLRGSYAMRQAYFYYAGILLAIYAALTFFGGLIFKAVNYIPMAGLEVNIGRGTLTSPSWPLTLAIGMAGFAPLLRPVEVLETWLRRQVHGWAGVPMQLKERTRRLLLTLDQHTRPAVQKAILANGNSHKPDQTDGNGVSVATEERAGEDPIVQKVNRVKPWMRILLERTGNFAPLIRKWTELEILTEAIRDPGSWPDTHVLDELQPLAREQRQTAERALLALEDLFESAYPEENRGGIANGSTNQEAEKEVHARQRRQVENMLEDTVAKIDKSRLELAAILAVYAERSPYLEEASDAGQEKAKASDLHTTLKAAVKEITPLERRSEPGFWVLILLPPIFCTYALMTRLGLHSPLSDVDLTAMTIFATAALETLQVALVFLLPVLAVLALRQYLTDVDRRRHLGNLHTRRQSTERMIYYTALATVVAAFGLTLLAMFWTALISDNTDRFLDLLYTRKQSAFGVFIPKSVCAAIFACFVIRASERWPQGKLAAIIYGAIGAVTTAAAVLGLSLAWLSGCLTDVVACKPFETLKAINLNPERSSLYRFYNLTDLVVYFTVVFVAVTNAAWPPSKHATETGSAKQKTPDGLVLGRTATSALFIAGFAMVVASSGTTFAGEVGPQSPTAEPITVRAGFRADAEPFSYKAGPLGTQRYRGYAADLCYSIFANSPYHLEEVEVNATDRFDSFRTEAPERKTEINILCDPTTLRFWRSNETIDGYFSPIVFVTGVSYLVRRVSGSRAGTDLAYVENTTAEQVAARACEVDLFGINSSSGQSKDCTTRHATCPESPGITWKVPLVRLCPFPTYNALTEWFCSQRMGRQQVYFGDREIIQAKFDSWRTARRCHEQDVERFAAFYTYEPYALLVSRHRPELARFVQRRVYDFFSHRTKAIALFTTYFPDVQISPIMANLMLLNGIDEPMYDTVPSYLFDQKSGVEPPSDTDAKMQDDQDLPAQR